VITGGVAAAPEGFDKTEYDKLAQEFVTEVRTFMEQSFQCEEEFRISGKSQNPNCFDAVQTGLNVMSLSKIVNFDEDHKAGINDDLRLAYKVSSIRLIDTMKSGNPDLRTRRAATNKSKNNTDDSLGTSMVKLSLTLKDISWVNVKDSEGETLFNDLADAGKTLSFTSASELRVVVGRANAIKEIYVNGRLYNYTRYVKKNVLRLDLP
jgi:hypothetical protein